LVIGGKATGRIRPERRDRFGGLYETLTVTLHLVPTGNEKLGEYDKLAGVVFARRLREAENPRDPVVLAEAFTVVAEAFDRAGDPLEADKWRAKADAATAMNKTSISDN